MTATVVGLVLWRGDGLFICTNSRTMIFNTSVPVLPEIPAGSEEREKDAAII